MGWQVVSIPVPMRRMVFALLTRVLIVSLWVRDQIIPSRGAEPRTKGNIPISIIIMAGTELMEGPGTATLTDTREVGIMVSLIIGQHIKVMEMGQKTISAHGGTQQGTKRAGHQYSYV